MSRVSGPDGNVFVDDAVNSHVRKIDHEGQVTTIAGDGTQGLVNGAGTIAEFSFSDEIGVDRQGNLFVADYGNFCIRKVAPDGTVTRFAGSGVRGYAEGDANTAEFSTIGDIVSASLGNIYVTDDNRFARSLRKASFLPSRAAPKALQTETADQLQLEAPLSLLRSLVCLSQ